MELVFLKNILFQTF